MDDETLVLDRTGYVATDGAGDAVAADDSPVPEFHEAGLLSERELCAPDTGQRLGADPRDAPSLARAPAANQNGQPSPDQIIEALLFAADTPLSLNRLTELVGACSPVQVRLHIAALNDKYVAAGLSFRIESIARGYQMMTLPRFQPWVDKLNQQRAQTRLSPAALEALSIVAYKQPVIRADVEAIRGVACGDILNRLREMGLLKIVGRAEVVGRPLLYGTTKKFLDAFGLADLDDLPPMEALALRRQPVQAETPPEPSVVEVPLAVSA